LSPCILHHASGILHRASCILLIALIGLATVCPAPLRTVAFAWDGETFRQQDAPGVAIPPPETVQQADLDGDGVAETVELQNGVLRLTDNGQVAWQSDPTWTVTRFALTDIDNDGALDIFFVLWKPDQEPVFWKKTGSYPRRCHPFIYGWRREAWRPLWFGSAVADPILDFVVGDVDGDGRNELAVLENPPSPSQGPWSGAAGEGPGVRVGRHVAVWRFNQWWFQFLWRSEPGAYHDLGLKDVTGDGVSDIITTIAL